MMRSINSYMVRSLLFLLFTINNSIGLCRATVNNENNSAYWSGGMLVLTACASLYFLRAYIRSRKTAR